MKLANISFTTDGRTIVVPPEKSNGKIGIASKTDVEKNPDDYIIYCNAISGKRTANEIIK